MGPLKKGKPISLSFGSLAAGPSGDQFVVDISGDHVKWVYAKESQGKVLIKHVRHKRLEHASDEDVSSFLASCYDEFKITDRWAVCSIPSNLFISKNVDMPSNDPEEIRKIVILHAGRYTPYSREEIIIDYFSSTTPEQHYTNVLLIIINRTVANRFMNIFAQAGVYLEKIVISAEAMTRLYEAWVAGSPGEGAIGGIYVNDESTDIAIVDRGQMVFVRNIPLGAKNLKPATAATLTEFMKEIKQSFTIYQDQGVGRPVERLIMTGLLVGDSYVEGEIRKWMAQISIVNVQFKAVPYLEHFELAPEALQAVRSDPRLCLFDLFSVMTVNARLKIDLIPDEIKLQRKVRQGGKEIVSLGVIIMSCLLLVSVFLVTKIYLKNQRISRIEEMSQATFEEARSLENASTKSRVLRELLETRGKGLYVFDKLRSLVTDDIYLSGLTYDRQGPMTLTGTADSMSRVFAFVTSLGDSQFFKNVETKQTKTRKEQGKEVADFEIACTFEEPQ